MCISSLSQVYSWGSDKFGQLGRINAPSTVPNLAMVIFLMICNHFFFCTPSLLRHTVPCIKMNVLLCDDRLLRVSVCGTWQRGKRTLCCWLMESVISPYCTTAESRCWRALTALIPSPGPTPRRPPFCPSAWMFVQTVMKVYSVDTVIFFTVCRLLAK